MYNIYKIYLNFQLFVCKDTIDVEMGCTAPGVTQMRLNVFLFSFSDPKSPKVPQFYSQTLKIINNFNTM